MIRTKVVRPSLFPVLILAACFAVQAAQAATVAVGTCRNLVNFATIQGAIDSVPAGTTIKICPGTYPEQLLITKKLTLEGIGTATEDAVIILPPAGGVVVNASDLRGQIAAQILVQGTTGPVTISNLTVDGTGNKYNSDDLRGILYQDASGVVDHVAVRNEVPNDTPTGIQSGQGIFVETNTGTAAALTVENSSVHNYNKNGIVARYAGATLTAIGNYVQGAGAIDYIAQNGIEIAFGGATGTIKNNTVIDNFYTPTTDSAADILLYDAKESGSILISGNILGNSNVAISLFTDTPGTYGDGVSVTGNKILGTSTFDGIDVCTNNNTVTSNTIFNSAESGVHLDANCGGTGNGNTVKGNTLLESACAGILADPGTTSNGIGPNAQYTLPFPVTNSTAMCTLPGRPAHAKTHNKFKP
jgi:hypothetical protein